MGARFGVPGSEFSLAAGLKGGRFHRTFEILSAAGGLFYYSTVRCSDQGRFCLKPPALLKSRQGRFTNEVLLQRSDSVTDYHLLTFPTSPPPSFPASLPKLFPSQITMNYEP
jgi:hypothetical protein